ncbi:serine/threonine-protein kinase [Sinomonas terrae]|uniref:non-specific serine/threonine protein kinase n=1 Tax=Sinomonas terrae TaxID=2908838 RepID=A0ABS9U1M9_9MICC|nr:protein kinase [Sinomonas terrae]MCH6470602.1 protein kinase [Sinomonas terrae]
MEPTEPAVQGYDVVRLLGRGSTGDVWLVRQQQSGCLRAAKVLRAGVGSKPTAVHPLRHELRRQTVRSHPNLLTCLASATEARTGSPVLLTEYAAGGSLARLVAARGRLTAGETVTTVGPIAQAAASLHVQRTAHLDIAPSNILFTSEGRPLLADLGEARQVGDGAGATRGTDGFFDPFTAGAGAVRPAADVYGLGAVAWFCLVGSPPGPRRTRPPLGLLVPGIPTELAAAVEAALAEEPGERPTAAEFARAVLRSCSADPVDLAPAVEAEVLPELVTRLQEGSRRRRPAVPRRRGLAVPRRPRSKFLIAVWAASAAAGTAAVALAGAGALGIEDRSRGGAASAPATGTRWSALPEPLRRAADSEDPVQAVQALAEIRAQAVSRPDDELLGRVNVPGSEADVADRKLAADLKASGRWLEGFTSRVLSVELAGTDSGDGAAPGADNAEARGSTAVVRVRVVTSAFSVRGSDGAELQRPAEAKEQWLRIVLERRDPGWQVSRVLPAALPMIGG